MPKQERKKELAKRELHCEWQEELKPKATKLKIVPFQLTWKRKYKTLIPLTCKRNGKRKEQIMVLILDPKEKNKNTQMEKRIYTRKLYFSPVQTSFWKEKHCLSTQVSYLVKKFSSYNKTTVCKSD